MKNTANDSKDQNSPAMTDQRGPRKAEDIRNAPDLEGDTLVPVAVSPDVARSLPNNAANSAAANTSVDPKSLHNLLMQLFVGFSKPLNPTRAKAKQGEAVLAKRQGCDFSLICDDVQFDVHTGFLLGGADLIEEHIHPGGIEQNPPPVTFVFNGDDYNPIMVDRFVSFIYTNTYRLDKGGHARSLHHATSIPSGKSSDDYAVELDSPIQFHLIMYNMGERLRYQELMTVAHAKLAEAMLWASRLTVEVLLKILNWVHGSLGNEATKICMDQTGILRDLVVACTLRHLYMGLWSLQDVAIFENATQERDEFREELRMAIHTYKDILSLPEKVKIGNKRKRRG